MRRCLPLRYKTVVTGEPGKLNPSDVRYWGIVGANHCSQLTSYNTGSTFEDSPVVETGLAASCVDDDKGVLFAVQKGSVQETNLKTGGMCSLMWGSTDPQIHHFFKQLGVRCWTSTMTGKGHEIREWGEMETLWGAHFAKNPHLVNNMIMQNQKATQNPNFRPSNQTDEEEEDEEAAMNELSDYSLWQLERENGFLGRPPGGLDKVSALFIPTLDPLRKDMHKWIKRMNSRRDILIEGAKKAYSIPLVNAFAFHIDKTGIYIMGSTQDDPAWQEYFLEWGPSMVYDQAQMVQAWWVEFVRQADVSFDNVYVEKPDSITQ